MLASLHCQTMKATSTKSAMHTETVGATLITEHYDISAVNRAVLNEEQDVPRPPSCPPSSGGSEQPTLTVYYDQLHYYYLSTSSRDAYPNSGCYAYSTTPKDLLKQSILHTSPPSPPSTSKTYAVSCEWVCWNGVDDYVNT
jgi:hypothetical protein